MLGCFVEKEKVVSDGRKKGMKLSCSIALLVGGGKWARSLFGRRLVISGGNEGYLRRNLDQVWRNRIWRSATYLFLCLLIS